VGGRVLLHPRQHSVYPIFDRAAHNWVEGADLYATPPGLDPYRYSPLVATFFVPFSRLPPGPAGLLWRLLGVAVFCGGLAWWRRAVLPPALTRAQRALLFLLPAPLAFSNVNNGQANIVVIGLLLVAVAAVVRGRFTLAGACVAVACYFKLYPIAVGLLLVALYPRRLGPRLALALAAGFLLPFLAQRPGYVAAQYADWLRSMGFNDRQLLPRELWYRDFRLLYSLWVAPLSYGAYQAVQVVGGVLVAGACLWARRAGLAPPRLLTLLLGLGCCWMTGLGPATESSTYILLGPTAAWLVISCKSERHPVGLRALWLSGYGLLAASQAASWLPWGWGRELQSFGPQPLAALLFLAGLLYVAFRGSKAAARKEAVPAPVAAARAA
jgi:hypothetical protein